MQYVREKGLWIKRTIKECWDKTGRPPVTVRWVETNKGDDVNPNIRSRLVARQIRPAGQEAVFAPTPPLEALRMVISMGASTIGDWKRYEPHWESRMQISLVDINFTYE